MRDSPLGEKGPSGRMLGVETGRPGAVAPLPTAARLSTQAEQAGASPLPPSPTRKDNEQSLSQGPANPSPGGGRSSHGRQSSYSRACILEVGNLPRSPLWPPSGPWQHYTAPCLAQFPSKHLHRDTAKEHINTTAGQWHRPRSVEGTWGARLRGAWAVPLLPPFLCGTAQGHGAKQWEGAGLCRHRSLRTKIRGKGCEDSG